MLRYYKGNHLPSPDKYDNSFYAVDEDGNLFTCAAQRGTTWAQIDESSALEAVVMLGPNAFPKTNKRKRLIGKLLGHLIINPFKAFKKACEGNGDFIMGSLVAALLIPMIAALIIAISYAIFSSPAPDKTAAPATIVVKYSDGTSLQYPIQNIKPEAVEVKKK